MQLILAQRMLRFLQRFRREKSMLLVIPLRFRDDSRLYRS